MNLKEIFEEKYFWAGLKKKRFRIWLGYSKQMQYPVPTVNAIQAHKEL